MVRVKVCINISAFSYLVYAHGIHSVKYSLALLTRFFFLFYCDLVFALHHEWLDLTFVPKKEKQRKKEKNVQRLTKSSYTFTLIKEPYTPCLLLVVHRRSVSCISREWLLH